MRIILAAIAGLISFSTFLYKSPGLLLTKMGAILFPYGQVIATLHLWCSGLSWKFLFIHCLGILASLCTDTTEPHPAANFFLVQACLFLLCFFAAYNLDRHVRSLWQLFRASTPSEAPVSDVNVDDLPLLDPHLFDLVKLIESDSSSEEDHWPPDFPNEPFVVGNFTARRMNTQVLAPLPKNILQYPVKQLLSQLKPLKSSSKFN